VSALRVLVVEDCEDDAVLLLRELRRGGFEPQSRRVETAEAMSAALREQTWDVIVSDYSLPRFAAPEALALANESGLGVPFIIVSGTVNEEIAVDSLKRGASDFIAKGNLARLVPAMRRELAVAAEHRERRRLEAQLRQSQKMEAIGQLAGGIAHDFNNLLAVITSYSELLIDGMPGDDERRDDLHEIRRAAERATALTRQLLAFSRRQVLLPTVVDLNAAVRDLERMLRRAIGRDIEFEAALDDTIGRVRVDLGQLDQILINLAVNARDAMPSGGKLRFATANVALGPEYAAANPGVTAGDYVAVYVSDTGVGMDAETLARAFEPFFTTKEVGKGTGLGLSTVFGIVRQSGGHVAVESAVGRGTTFQVYLPRIAEGDAAPDGAR
jgi:signal transduction histidine kinase